MNSEIRKAIHARLKELTSNVYHLKAPKAPKKVKYPYITYKMKIYKKDTNIRIINLTIDGWDSKADTTRLEQMMSSINALDATTLSTENYILTLKAENQEELDDSELEHRQYTYNGILVR